MRDKQVNAINYALNLAEDNFIREELYDLKIKAFEGGCSNKEVVDRLNQLIDLSECRYTMEVIYEAIERLEN